MIDTEELRQTLTYNNSGDQLVKDAADEIERLRKILIDEDVWKNPPCCICGYNGKGYFQPATHPCSMYTRTGND